MNWIEWILAALVVVALAVLCVGIAMAATWADEVIDHD